QKGFFHHYLKGESGSFAMVLYTILSINAGKNLFKKTVHFPVPVSTKFDFLFSIAFNVSKATSSGCIIFDSFRGVSPCMDPSPLSAVFRILLAVNPGQTMSTCKPVFLFSIRKLSRNPCMANLEAL